MRSFTGQLGTLLSQPANVQLAVVPTASINAKQCFFPRSSWVYAFILTCDNTLAVWFRRGGPHRRHHHRRKPRRHRKHHRHSRHRHHRRHRPRRRGVPGLCCLFPGTGPAHYQLACAWRSPGQFVHGFLYRKFGCRPVAPPRVPCGPCPGQGGSGSIGSPYCPNGLPATMHITFTGAASGSVALTYNPVLGAWTGATVLCGGDSSQIVLSCLAVVGGGYGWFLSLVAASRGCAVVGAVAASSAVCSPFNVVFNFTGAPPTCCAGSLTATVTS
jgi:hypothetical protein